MSLGALSFLQEAAEMFLLVDISTSHGRGEEKIQVEFQAGMTFSVPRIAAESQRTLSRALP